MNRSETGSCFHIMAVQLYFMTICQFKKGNKPVGGLSTICTAEDAKYPLRESALSPKMTPFQRGEFGSCSII